MIKQVFEKRPRQAQHIAMSDVRRRHRVEVARWVLANGRPMERDSLSLIIATRDVQPDGALNTRWSCGTVGSLLGWQADAWCATHGVPRPERLAESLTTYLEYLLTTRLLSDRSDHFEDLRDEIDHIGTCADEDDQGMGNSLRDSAGTLIQLIPKKSNVSARPS